MTLVKLLVPPEASQIHLERAGEPPPGWDEDREKQHACSLSV